MTSPPLDLPVESDAACSAAIGEIGDIDHALARIETNKSEMIAIATATAENEATPLLIKKGALMRRVAAWCDKERARLTGGTQHADFPAGTVAWHENREVCEIDDAKGKKITDRLKKLVTKQLEKLINFWAPFVTISFSLSKTALKLPTLDEKTKTRLRRAGIRVVKPPESFTITPTSAALADRPEAATQGD